MANFKAAAPPTNTLHQAWPRKCSTSLRFSLLVPTPSSTSHHHTRLSKVCPECAKRLLLETSISFVFSNHFCPSAMHPRINVAPCPPLCCNDWTGRSPPCTCLDGTGVYKTGDGMANYSTRYKSPNFASQGATLLSSSNTHFSTLSKSWLLATALRLLSYRTPPPPSLPRP